MAADQPRERADDSIEPRLGAAFKSTDMAQRYGHFEASQRFTRRAESCVVARLAILSAT